MTYTDILTNVRSYMGVDANKWSTAKITLSVNKALNKIAGYAIGADKTFRWDDTNHTKMPIGTTPVILNQTRYSFLTDEQGNRILTLLGVSLVDPDGVEKPLMPIDRTSENYDLRSFGTTSGLPTYYDKVSDNVIEFDKKPDADTVANYSIKFRFQRTPSLFTVSDTTKEPGFSPELDEYIIICAALEGAISLGLSNLAILKQTHDEEYERMTQYFTRRNEDSQPFRMTGRVIDGR